MLNIIFIVLGILWAIILVYALVSNLFNAFEGDNEELEQAEDEELYKDWLMINDYPDSNASRLIFEKEILKK